MTTRTKTLGETAYEAWREKVCDIEKRPVLSWADTDPTSRVAFEAAAQALVTLGAKYSSPLSMQVYTPPEPKHNSYTLAVQAMLEIAYDKNVSAADRLIAAQAALATPFVEIEFLPSFVGIVVPNKESR